MSVNNSRPHVLVLPEDDANRQLANGFLLDPSLSPTIRVLEEVGGWREVLNRFLSDHLAGMRHNPGRSMILLLDFDGDEDRLNWVKARIPEDLIERVYVIGALREPEDLRRVRL